MNIEFTSHAWEEFCFWMETDPSVAFKIKDLIKAIDQSPFRGLGKPEPLKYEYKGFWSRRINIEHRMVYKITGKKGIDQKCIIFQCRFHYRK